MCFSYLFVGEGVQVLVVRTEEEVSQDGAAVTHHHVLIQQGRLGNRVDQDLKESRGRVVNLCIQSILLHIRSHTFTCLLSSSDINLSTQFFLFFFFRRTMTKKTALAERLLHLHGKGLF